jgi:Skp family chaperone for outer membrane proteins
MKKGLLSLLVIAGFIFGSSAQAQTKIGVFDIERMVMLMPGYRNVDSLTQIYERDSLQNEYSDLRAEYNRLDSLYKLDSASHAKQSVLDYQKKNIQQVAFQLVYWQQIAQNKLENKRGTLAQPIYEQVFNAYKKVVEARKYTLILKPESFEILSTGIENIFPYVARELKVQLPAEYGGGQPLDDEPKKAGTGTPARPATGTPRRN